MKTLKIFSLFLLAGMILNACDKGGPVVVPPHVSNIAFTECNDNNRNDNSSQVVVEFTNSEVHITHYGLGVNCDFDTVIITQNLQNSVLNIIEQGEPNSANCICYTDVSYTISGVPENAVNTIIINGDTVWTAQTPTSEYWKEYPEMADWEFNQVYIANSDAELAAHPVFLDNTVNCICPNNLFTPDWTTQSVIITYGAAPMSHICDIKTSFMQQNAYQWNVVVYNYESGYTVMTPYLVAKLVDKLSSDANINLQTNFSFCNSETQQIPDGTYCGIFEDYEGDFTLPSSVCRDSACITFAGNTYVGVGVSERFAHSAFCSQGTFSINENIVTFVNMMVTPTDWMQALALGGDYSFTLNNNVLTLQKNSDGLGGYYIYTLTKQ